MHKSFNKLHYTTKGDMSFLPRLHIRCFRHTTWGFIIILFLRLQKDFLTEQNNIKQWETQPAKDGLIFVYFNLDSYDQCMDHDTQYWIPNTHKLLNDIKIDKKKTLFGKTHTDTDKHEKKCPHAYEQAAKNGQRPGL